MLIVSTFFVSLCFFYSEHKMFLYSSHDTSIMALLLALGVFDNKWPDYAADLRIELYQKVSTILRFYLLHEFVL